MKDSGSDARFTRRSTLRMASMAGAAAVLPAAPVSAEDSGTSLGSFEESLDAWTTNGSNDLTRVDDDDRPYAVKAGSHALQVTTTGDPYPMIENKTKVRDADLVKRPYLVASATVGPLAENPDPVTFVLRLHHESTGGSKGGQGGNQNGSGKKPVLVEETRITIPQRSDALLSWDMTEIEPAKRARANRLEVGWYVAETPPDHGPHGNGPGDGLSGDVVFDRIRATNDLEAIETAAVHNHVQSLRAERGVFDYEVTEYTADGERGEFQFDDGSVVEVEWVDVGPDRERYTVGDRTFELGGGWE